MTLEEYNRLNTLAEAQQQLQLHKESMFMRGNADEIVAKYVPRMSMSGRLLLVIKKLCSILQISPRKA